MKKTRKQQAIADGKWIETHIYPCESYKRVTPLGALQEVIQAPNKKRWRLFIEDVEKFSHADILKVLEFADCRACEIPNKVTVSGKRVYAVNGRGPYCVGTCIVAAITKSTIVGGFISW
jgi:hypothetical protein